MSDTTIAAIATGMSPSGVGIIRISGDESLAIISSLFRLKNGNRISSFENRKIYYGFIFDDDKCIDEVLTFYMKSPHSFTGEDVVEIQCHGGILMINKILDLVLRSGALAAGPGEFTKRAFLNGRMDLSEAEAVMDIISAQSEYALSNSVKHLNGRLFDTIDSARKSIVYEIAYIESALDDPEHFELSGYPNALRVKLEDIFSKLSKLSESFNDGKVLSEGINTVILGKPNVGKSSLLNLLSGSQRAIVTDIAGTTRDVISERIIIDGIPLNIFDTAGIHNSDDYVEQIGINKALDYALEADLIIMIVDSSVSFSNQDEAIFDFIKKNKKKAIILLNKSDLEQLISPEEIAAYIDAPVILFSALSKLGLEEFKEYIRKNFLSGVLKYNDELFISNARQKEALDNCLNSLNQVISSIDRDLPEDFYTIDLTDAYDHLGFIIGEQTSEDVIEEIFNKFCVGK